MRPSPVFAVLFAALAAAAAPATAPARAGEIFVVNYGDGAGTGSVGAYDATTGATINASLISGLTYPNVIAALDGNLLVGQLQNGTIGEYAPDGTVINASLIAGPNATGLAVSGGDVFVANEFGLTEYTTGGAFVMNFTLPHQQDPAPFTSMAESGTDLFVSGEPSYASVGEYTTSGATVNSTLVGGLSNPNAIAVSGTDVFVGWGSTVGEYTTSGATVNASLVTGLDGIGGIAVSGGDLFVTAGGASGVISEYTTSGALVNASFITGLDQPANILITPEPSTWILFAIGAAALIACGRQRRTGTLVDRFCRNPL